MVIDINYWIWILVRVVVFYYVVVWLFVIFFYDFLNCGVIWCVLDDDYL